MGRPGAHHRPPREKRVFRCKQFVLDYIRKSFTTYEMPKVVVIQYSWVGTLFRIFELSIIAYFIGWILIWEKGYQAFERPIHGVSAKVRGTVFSNIDGANSHLAGGPIVYTDADLVRPPIQNAGFFLVTRIYSTVQQLQGFCPESPDLIDARCETNLDCPHGEIAGTGLPDKFKNLTSQTWFDVENNGHGPFTGRCLPETRTCEVFAWCPVLHDTYAQNDIVSPVLQEFCGNRGINSYPSNVHRLFRNSTLTEKSQGEGTPFYETLNFTVFIRNSIEFPFYKVKLSNVLSWMDNTYLNNCTYNSTDKRDKYCPLFRIGDILQATGVDIADLLLKGGIIDIVIHWDCNLDISLNKCVPRYNFRYIGSLSQEERGDYANGIHTDDKYYLEFPYYYGSQNVHRMLLKTNGIQFIVSVTGKAGKFSLLQFSMKLGSSLGFFGTATLLCDLVLVYLSGDRKRYKRTVSRLGTLTQGVAFLARLKKKRPPPKPNLTDPKQLTGLIEFYQAHSSKLILPGIRINLASNEEGLFEAKVMEDDRQCPSLIRRNFKPVKME